MKDTMQTVVDYHERTKHQPHAYARSLGYLDWATQPDPFRRFQGAAVLPLAYSPDFASPAYDALFTGPRPAQPVGYQTISQLLLDALALSAWRRLLQAIVGRCGSIPRAGISTLLRAT